jgi:anti-anti-sigma factor
MSGSVVVVPALAAAPAPPSPQFAAAEPPDDATGADVVTVAGELDIARVAELDYELRRAEARTELVVVDLRTLEFIDSSGARLLVAAHRRARSAGGRMLVVRGPAEVEWFLALIGVDRELELVDWPPIGHSLPSDRVIV